MLLEELEPLPGYLQYRHGSKVIIKIIDIVPYIDVLRYILPLFQLSGKCLFFCIFTVYPAEREVYGADNYSCIGRQEVVKKKCLGNRWDKRRISSVTAGVAFFSVFPIAVHEGHVQAYGVSSGAITKRNFPFSPKLSVI